MTMNMTLMQIHIITANIRLTGSTATSHNVLK